MTTQTLHLPASVDAAVRAPRRWYVFALAMAVLAYSLMQTMLVPALPLLQSELGVDRNAVGWVLTAYLLSGAVAAPVLGAMGDRFGHRRVLVLSMAAFVVGSVVAALAPNLVVLLAGRVLQGTSTASFPLALAIVRRHADGRARTSAIGWLSGTLGLGAGIALVIGGVLAEVAPWPVLFWTGAAFGVASIALVCWSVPRSPAGGTGRVDLAGVGLLSVLLVAALLAVSQVSSWGLVSVGTISTVLLAVAAGIALFAVERRVSAPLLDLAALLRPSIAITNVVTVFVGFVPYVFYVGLPILLQGVGGHSLSVRDTGLAMFPAAILTFVGGRLAPALIARMGASRVGFLALGLMALGAVGTAVGIGSLPTMIGLFALVGLGNGIGFAVVAELTALSAPASEVASLLGVNGVLRTVGSAFGAPVVALILAGSAGVGGFVTAFLVAAGASVVGAVLSLTLRTPRSA